MPKKTGSSCAALRYLHTIARLWSNRSILEYTLTDAGNCSLKNHLRRVNEYVPRAQLVDKKPHCLSINLLSDCMLKCHRHCLLLLEGDLATFVPIQETGASRTLHKQVYNILSNGSSHHCISHILTRCVHFNATPLAHYELVRVKTWCRLRLE